MRQSILISGALAQSAGNGGLTWCFLQLVLGFRRLEWDVLFLDRLEPLMCVDDAGRPATLESSVNLRSFLRVMKEFGLGDSYSLSYNRGERAIGQPRAQVLEWARGADLLLNVMGYLDDEEILGRVGRR